MPVQIHTHGIFKPSPQRTALLIFFISYCFAIIFFYHASSRDPTSAFFQPTFAFEPQYSQHRKLQADAFIDATHITPFPKNPPSNPSIAIGIATIQRKGQRYFKTAVGSLLDGLTPGEREAIHLTSFIADVDPNTHQAYNESWLHTLSDHVMTYADAPVAEQARLARLQESDTSHVRKPMQDYIHLLQACYDTGAPLILMLEDDVIALDGWLHRTLRAAYDLERRGALSSTIYLRLFYNSGILGWNSERWPAHLFWSASIALLVSTTLYLSMRFAPSASLKKFLTVRTSLAIIFLCTPLLIGLYYAAGRLTVSPLPTGLVRMDTHGCCSQAFLFPRPQIPNLITYYRAQGEGLIDQMTEKYADEARLERWALVPSVFQHVGATSSKTDDGARDKWQRTGAGNIWNFDFERFDPVRLEREHRGVVSEEELV